jgi:hypothetical protein
MPFDICNECLEVNPEGSICSNISSAVKPQRLTLAIITGYLQK